MHRALRIGLWLAAGVVSVHAEAKSFTLGIQRNMSGENGATVGRLLVNGQEIARTLELPWRDNATDVSRVPA